MNDETFSSSWYATAFSFLKFFDFSTRRPPDVLEQPSQSQSLRNIHLEESAFSLLPRANWGSNQSFAWYPALALTLDKATKLQELEAETIPTAQIFFVDEAQSIIPLEINVINSRQKSSQVYRCCLPV